MSVVYLHQPRSLLSILFHHYFLHAVPSSFNSSSYCPILKYLSNNTRLNSSNFNNFVESKRQSNLFQHDKAGYEAYHTSYDKKYITHYNLCKLRSTRECENVLFSTYIDLHTDRCLFTAYIRALYYLLFEILNIPHLLGIVFGPLTTHLPYLFVLFQWLITTIINIINTSLLLTSMDDSDWSRHYLHRGFP